MIGNETDARRVHRASSGELLSRRPKKMTFAMPHETHVKLRTAAAREDRYIRDILKDAIDEYLKKHGHV